MVTSITILFLFGLFSMLRELFNAKVFLREQPWYYLTHGLGDKEVQYIFQGY